MAENKLKKRLSSRDRPVFDTAIEQLESEWLIERKAIQRNGIDGHLIRSV
jgi:hypothetical protein